MIKILIVALLLLTSNFAKAEEPFRFYLTVQPETLSPADYYVTEPAYLISNLFRGLYRLNNKGEITPEGAKSCSWDKSRLILKCELNPQIKWSDDVSVKAQDYVRAFQYLVTPETKAREISHMMKLKNAKEIIKGEVKPEKLGVEATDDFHLKFTFEEKDPDFIAKLTSRVLTPWRTVPDIKKATETLTNGPYKIKILNTKKAYLVKNEHYPYGNPSRPDVEIYFVDELSTGQNLFDLGKINFLPQLNTMYYPKYKDHKGLFNVVFSRFDYVGFGAELQKNIHLRKALALSVNYDELKEILFATGRPGCPSLTSTYIAIPQCYPFDVKKAQEELKKVPKNELPEKITFKYSLASGQQLARIIEWYQNQWKKNLGIKIEIAPEEQGMFLQNLKMNPPDIFRKGITLDRPSCLSALEVFRKDGPDNIIKFSSKKYESILDQLANELNESKKKKLCEAGIKILMDEYRIIPQGVMHFTMIKDDKFEGFDVNELNQLDLSNLRAKK